MWLRNFIWFSLLNILLLVARKKFKIMKIIKIWLLFHILHSVYFLSVAFIFYFIFINKKKLKFLEISYLINEIFALYLCIFTSTRHVSQNLSFIGGALTFASDEDSDSSFNLVVLIVELFFSSSFSLFFLRSTKLILFSFTYVSSLDEDELYIIFLLMI